MTNILWLKGGACSGNTMSFLSAEEPNVIELITDFGINILYHPTLALEIGKQVSNLLRDIVKGKMEVDIFVFEGSVIQGPAFVPRLSVTPSRKMFRSPMCSSPRISPVNARSCGSPPSTAQG